MHLSKKLLLEILFVSLIAASAVSAQTVSIVSGDGQVAVQNNQAQAQMIVVVKNFQGQPVVGTQVTWSLNGQGSLVFGSSTVTDANGMGYNQFLGGTLFGVSFTQSIITASAFGSSVNFTQTTSGQDPVSLQVFITANVNSPTLGQVLSGSGGSVGTQPVQVQVTSVGPSGASGVPNVLVHLIPSTTTGPQVACAGSSGYSNATGLVNCLPVFSGTTGSSSFTVDVGGAFRTFGPFSFTVTQSTVTTFRVTGGSNQSGAPGSTLPLPLTAQALDINGNPLPNVPVTWQVLTPNAATITNSSTVSDSNGNVSASIKLGTTVGQVQIQLSSSQGGTPVVFNLTVTQQVTGVNKVAGDQQSAVINTTYAQPLVVQVNTSQGPAAGVPVLFASSGASVTVSARSHREHERKWTGLDRSAGGSRRRNAATVTASAGSFSATFTLTVALPGPQVTSNSFFNAAGGQAGGVSPSALVAIYGAGIADGLQGCVDGSTVLGPLQLLVSNVTVEFIEGSYQQFGPIYTVCNLGGGQEYVVVQVPTDLPLRRYQRDHQRPQRLEDRQQYSGDSRQPGSLPDDDVGQSAASRTATRLRWQLCRNRKRGACRRNTARFRNRSGPPHFGKRIGDRD